MNYSGMKHTFKLEKNGHKDGKNAIFIVISANIDKVVLCRPLHTKTRSNDPGTGYT